MARARLIVVTSQRLDRLDGLLVAAGAEGRHVARVDDAFDLFELESTENCLLLLDLDSTPDADAGLLRRWCERHPEARVVWIGGSPERVASFARTGAPGTWLRWPLDLDDLGRLAAGRLAVRPAVRPVGPQAAEAAVERGAESDAAAEPESTPDAEPGPEAEPGAGSTSGPKPGLPAADHRTPGNGVAELSRIEAILGRGPSSTDSEEPPGPSSSVEDRPRPRVAFLPSPPASTPSTPPPIEPPSGQGDAEMGLPLETAHTTETATELETDPLDELDLPPGPVSRIDELGLNEPLLTKDEIDAFFAPPGPLEGTAPGDLSGAATGDVTGAATGDVTGAATGDVSAHAGDIATRRPTWLKDQTADLADIVQGLDLRARANHAHVGLEAELARLRQFTKTIGFVASPPPPGSQDFDLATLVEEQLGDLAGDAPDAPRLLFRRSPEGTQVQADKMLVAMALEALLQTAVGCAGSGDVVRVSVDARIDTGPIARVEFPAGPLSDLRPEQILDPYALKTRLPQIGSNALAAAGGIAVGQGGDLIVEEASSGSLAFEISFSASPRS